MRLGKLSGIFSLPSCLKHSSSASSTSLRSGFPNCIILDPLCSNALFPNRLNPRIYETKFPTYVRFVSSFSISRIALYCPSTLHTCLLENKEIVEFPEQFTSWKIILELMSETVVISEVDVHYECSIQQGRQTRSLWGIS